MLSYPSLAAAEAANSVTQIHAAVCKRPNIIRPPYRSISDLRLNMLQRMGFAVLSFSVDTMDWQEADDCVSVFMDALDDGPDSMVVVQQVGQWRCPPPLPFPLTPLPSYYMYNWMFRLGGRIGGCLVVFGSLRRGRCSSRCRVAKFKNSFFFAVAALALVVVVVSESWRRRGSLPALVVVCVVMGLGGSVS